MRRAGVLSSTPTARRTSTNGSSYEIIATISRERPTPAKGEPEADAPTMPMTLTNVSR